MSGKSSAAWWQVLFAVVLMGLGFLLVVQLRAGRALSGQEGVPTRNVYALATMLGQERAARRGLEAQVASLNARLAAFETAAVQRRSSDRDLAAELERLRIAAGAVALSGPGVLVTIGDGTGPGGAPAVVQYVDLASLANELWAAGAEAEAVSGYRLGASTGFSQVGGTILAGGQRLAAPYEIVAIGDPDTLAGAMNIRGGVVDALRGLGLHITVAPSQHLAVPAARSLATTHFAHPAPP
jgi:uncharacterized protein YlxW (UPF0749 family)